MQVEEVSRIKPAGQAVMHVQVYYDMTCVKCRQKVGQKVCAHVGIGYCQDITHRRWYKQHIWLCYEAILIVAMYITRWEEKLPPEVVAAAHRGEHCPLFWPQPSEDTTGRGRGGPSGPAVGASVQPVDRMLLPIKALMLKVQSQGV